MTTDLIQRAAAICGYPFTPNSDQLAAWFDMERTSFEIDVEPGRGWTAELGYKTKVTSKWHWTYLQPQPDLLHLIAAAVVEVDRIERDAKKP